MPLYIEITERPSPKEGIEIGDVFLARAYLFDPSEKFTLIRKVEGSKKKYKEQTRNHYRINCKILKNYTPPDQ